MVNENVMMSFFLYVMEIEKRKFKLASDQAGAIVGLIQEIDSGRICRLFRV